MTFILAAKNCDSIWVCSDFLMRSYDETFLVKKVHSIYNGRVIVGIAGTHYGYASCYLQRIDRLRELIAQKSLSNLQADLEDVLGNEILLSIEDLSNYKLSSHEKEKYKQIFWQNEYFFGIVRKGIPLLFTNKGEHNALESVSVCGLGRGTQLNTFSSIEQTMSNSLSDEQAIAEFMHCAESDFKQAKCNQIRLKGLEIGKLTETGYDRRVFLPSFPDLD